jgi:hypothetical protein
MKVFRTLAGIVGTEAPEISACKCPTCSASSGPTQQRSAGLAGPTPDQWVTRFRQRADASSASRVRDVISQNRHPIGPAPAPNVKPGALIPAGPPPDLGDAIRKKE